MTNETNNETATNETTTNMTSGLVENDSAILDMLMDNIMVVGGLVVVAAIACAAACVALSLEPSSK